MKIGLFEVEGWERHFFRKLLKGHSLTFFKEPLTEKNVSIAKGFDSVSVFIYSKLNGVVLKQLHKLKMITTRSTGFDHIDVGECKKRKIVLCNVPSYGENTVAEHTFALILTLSRKIHEAHMRRMSNNYTIEGLKGFDLKGRTIGIVGLGKIGKHVARIANGFEMKLLACDRHPDAALAKTLGITYTTFNELLKKSDIITLHVPSTKENYHLINKRNVKTIKRGALFINTARGELVDTEALIWALDKKILAGVGLDVLEGEELIKEEKQLLYDEKKHKQIHQLAEDHMLLARDNVVFTPHIAFYSKEALERIIEKTAESINGFAKDKVDRSCVIC